MLKECPFLYFIPSFFCASLQKKKRILQVYITELFFFFQKQNLIYFKS